VPTTHFRLFWLLIPALLLIQACDNGGLFSPRPKGVLSKKQMTGILIDIHLQEAIMRTGNNRPANPADLKKYTRAEYLKLFANHDVTPEQFDQSLDYYLLHVDDLDEIYTNVINRIEEMEAETRGSHEKPPAKQSKPETKEQGGNTLKKPSEK